MRHKVNPLRHIINFNTDTNLHITMETERLMMRSVTRDDEADCIALLGDDIVMNKFATGVPYDIEKVKARIVLWVGRWENHNPFSIYVIQEKLSGEFMGIMAIQPEGPGESEASYAIHHRFWGKGYGSEAANAIFQSLIPRLMLRGYKIEHKSLKKLVATARLDNEASLKMLRGVGFKEEEKIEKYGAWRFSFGLFAKQLRNEYQNFFIRNSQRQHQQELARIKNRGVDVTDEEMADSAFGQQAGRFRS
jgi:RimJ/RimL family protein N-acetyltransferase